jgi:hypothetical protein
MTGFNTKRTMANDRLAETANDPLPIEGLMDEGLIDSTLIDQWIAAGRQRTMVYIARVLYHNADYDDWDILIGAFTSQSAAMNAIVDWYRDAYYDDTIEAADLDDFSDSYAYIIDKVPML